MRRLLPHPGNEVPSPRVLAACARFGLTVHPPERTTRALPRSCRWAPRFARLIDRLLSPGQIALITGPSGAGKSVLLRALELQLRSRALRVPARPGKRRLGTALADLDSGPLDDWLRHLARAGLAEAGLLPRPLSTFSDGQLWRAMLAQALARASRCPTARPLTLLADEFTSSLDRTTARAIAHTLARILPAERRARLVVSTTHDDILEPLRPNLVLHVHLAAPPEVLMP